MHQHNVLCNLAAHSTGIKKRKVATATDKKKVTYTKHSNTEKYIKWNLKEKREEKPFEPFPSYQYNEISSLLYGFLDEMLHQRLWSSIQQHYWIRFWNTPLLKTNSKISHENKSCIFQIGLNRKILFHTNIKEFYFIVFNNSNISHTKW